MNKYTFDEVISTAKESINRKIPESRSFDISLITKQGDIFLIELKSGENSKQFSALYKEKISARNSQVYFNKISYSETYNLLITNYLTDSIADEAVSRNIQFFDMAGNTHLEINNSFYLLSGNKIGKGLAPKSVRTEIHYAWLKVIFYILNYSGSLEFSLRSLAEHTNVSHSSIQQLDAFLKQKSFLTVLEGKKCLAQKLELFNLWLDNFNNKLVDKISFGKFRLSADKCIDLINGNGVDYLISGSSALSIFNNEIDSNNFVVYSNDPDLFSNKFSLIRDPKGNIELRKKFWKDFNSFNPYGIAPIILFVADLMNCPNEIGRKTGTKFFESCLSEVLKEEKDYSLQNLVKYFKELV